VFGNARVFDNARVYGDARVFDNARVSGNAQVYGDTQVSGDAQVYGDTQVSGDARVTSIVLTANRSDGYTFSIFTCADGIVRFTAGCRYFTYEKAIDHWTTTRGGTKLGKESIMLIEHLRAMYQLQSE